jgi:hypothetical protein
MAQERERLWWSSTGVGYRMGPGIQLMVEQADRRDGQAPAFRARLSVRSGRHQLSVSGQSAADLEAALDRRVPGWREQWAPLRDLIAKTPDALARARDAYADKRAAARAQAAAGRMASRGAEAGRAVLIYDSRTGFTREGAALVRALRGHGEEAER